MGARLSPAHRSTPRSWSTSPLPAQRPATPRPHLQAPGESAIDTAAADAKHHRRSCAPQVDPASAGVPRDHRCPGRDRSRCHHRGARFGGEVARPGQTLSLRCAGLLGRRPPPWPPHMGTSQRRGGAAESVASKSRWLMPRASLPRNCAPRAITACTLIGVSTEFPAARRAPGCQLAGGGPRLSRRTASPERRWRRPRSAGRVRPGPRLGSR
jgi:hypothetical protein